MTNAIRGEVPFRLGGRTRALVLTLGALAEMEQALPSPGLAGLAARLAEGKLTVSDAITVIAAGCAGAGEAIARDDLARMIPASDLGHVLTTAAALLAASFGEGNSSRPSSPQAAN